MKVVEDVYIKVLSVNRTDEPKLFRSLIHANMLLILESYGPTSLKRTPLSVHSGSGLQDEVHYMLNWIDLRVVVTENTLLRVCITSMETSI